MTCRRENIGSACPRFYVYGCGSDDRSYARPRRMNRAEPCRSFITVLASRATETPAAWQAARCDYSLDRAHLDPRNPRAATTARDVLRTPTVHPNSADTSAARSLPRLDRLPLLLRPRNRHLALRLRPEADGRSTLVAAGSEDTSILVRPPRRDRSGNSSTSVAIPAFSSW